jgi:membrane fusion protein, heavy metal efflux system
MASRPVVVNRGTLLGAAVFLVALGAGGAWLLRARQAPGPAASAGETAAPASPAADPGPVTITLSKEAAERAGIELATVAMSRDAVPLRIPGIVQADAYKTVVVTAVAGGRVTRVLAELGQSVRRGQALAEIYSPELAEARTRYLSARAELGAHELELQRTEKLVAIGAASRRELEKIHAEHASALAMVESYRSRLALLGVSEQDMARPSSADTGAMLRVVAPSNGTVTARAANVGLNVDPAMPLFTIADLSSVWVVGDLYEQDFAVATVGEAATVSVPAFPEMEVAGKIAYIDPQVKPETRTAQVRVDVPNPKGQLRLGMLAEVRLIDTRAGSVLTIPRAAVQNVGNRTVVYAIDPSDPARFVERDVILGAQGAFRRARCHPGRSRRPRRRRNGARDLGRRRRRRRRCQGQLRGASRAGTNGRGAATVDGCAGRFRRRQPGGQDRGHR